MTLAQALATLPTLTVEGETLWQADGDLWLTEVELQAWLERGAPDPAMHGLTGALRDGRKIRWAPGVVLSCAVDVASFRSDQEAAIVVDATRAATKDWNARCGCQFEFLGALEDHPDPLFVIRYVGDEIGDTLALAFFPYHTGAKRRILIGSGFFDTGWDPTGMMRHELGHVLGFWHEHDRSGGGVLTEADPVSVMMYPPAHETDWKFFLSELDERGSQAVYGPSLSGFLLFGGG